MFGLSGESSVALFVVVVVVVVVVVIVVVVIGVVAVVTLYLLSYSVLFSLSCGMPGLRCEELPLHS